jgi:cardiolipin synthase
MPRNAANKAMLHCCEVVPGGVGYFERLLRLIGECREVMHLQYYILSHDNTGKEIQHAILEARSRGVEVFIVLDGIGSMDLPQRVRQRLLDAGIQLRFFSPVRFSIPFRTGRRLHHKLAVFDREKALVGGLNLADRYRGSAQEPPWLDFAVYLEGAICAELHELAEGYAHKKSYPAIAVKKILAKDTPLGKSQAEARVNDLFKGRREVRRGYHRALANARHSVTIAASYFLPKRHIIKLLRKAAERGVATRLILPAQTDVPFYQTAVKYLYPRLLRAGVQIYEYRPSVLHAKVAVADGRWCTIGSYNLNDLSDLLSVELNIEIFDHAIASGLQEQLDAIIAHDCRRVDENDYLQASWTTRLKWRLYYVGILQSIRILHWFTEERKVEVDL